MSFSQQYFDAFSEYLSTDDATKLLQFLQPDSNSTFLKIYRNGAFKSALDALASNFPTVKSLIGDKLFNTVGRSYILQHWPNNSCLSTYGDTFSRYLEEQSTSVAENGADFAALDRAWLDALFAEDEEALEGDAVLKIIQNDPDQIPKFKFVSSIRIVNLKHQCLSEWIKIKFDAGVESQDSKSISVIMWRREETVYYRSLSQFEHVFLNSIADCGCLSTSAGAALAAVPSGDISDLFSNLITAGMFAKCPLSLETTAS